MPMRYTFKTSQRSILRGVGLLRYNDTKLNYKRLKWFVKQHHVHKRK